MKEEGAIRTSVKDPALVKQRRELIVTEAVRLFLTKGYHNTTTKEIAEACGMSAGSLYQYISTKEDILHLAVQERKKYSEIVRQYVDEISEQDPVEGVRTLIWKSIHNLDDESYRDRSLFINHELANFPPEDRQEVRDCLTRDIAAIEDLIRRGVERGVFRARHPFLVACQIAMVEREWLVQGWLLGKRFSAEEYIKACTDSVLDQLMVEGPGYRVAGTGAGVAELDKAPTGARTEQGVGKASP